MNALKIGKEYCWIMHGFLNSVSLEVFMLKSGPKIFNKL